MRYQKILVYFTITLLILISSPRAEGTGADNDHPEIDKGLRKLDLCRADPEKNATGTPYDAVNARKYAA
jgi:hypothetical protein